MRKVLQLLGVLDETDVAWMASHGNRQFVEAGTELIRESEPIQWFYILLDGELSVLLDRRITNRLRDSVRARSLARCHLWIRVCPQPQSSPLPNRGCWRFPANCSRRN